MNICNFIIKQIKKALFSLGIFININPIVKKSIKSFFGHYQVNNIMYISKIINVPSMELAKNIVSKINLMDFAEKINVVDPGFINIYLSSKWISSQIDILKYSNRLGVSFIKDPKIIVIDYSSPNIAKEMHVGNMRSTIIGDVSARVLSFLGHTVIRANHVGDWGTQFGMLIAYLIETKKNMKNINISELNSLYQSAKEKYDLDKLFSEQSRQCVVQLQQGNKFYNSIWKILTKLTIKENQEIYKKLNVTLSESDIMGESSYNSMLYNIVSDLKRKKIAFEKHGAVIIDLNKNKKNTKSDEIVIQKSDGAYLYITTDIACIKYRCNILHANRIIYYTDSRQKQHLLQALIIAKKAGYISSTVSLEHHIFGMILGKNKKPIKTRDGNTVRLIDLINESIKRSRKFISEKNSSLNEKEINEISEIIGIGIIKYSDLSKHRIIDYVFDWNNMLSLEGNTLPYIQYNYVRAISILEKVFLNKPSFQKRTLLKTKIEIKLAIQILRFEEVITAVSNYGTPHILCTYLYELSKIFSIFYENCKILSIKNIIIKNSRICLSFLTSKILKKGLELLGIKVIKKM